MAKFRASLLTLFFFTGMMLFSAISYAEVVTAISSGNWTNGGTWDSGSEPVCGDTIVIPASITVVVNTQITLNGCPDPTFILVEGTLDFSNGKKMYLSAGSGVTVADNGEILGGGGGNANILNIGGTDVWNSSGGDVSVPTTFGEIFGVIIKSITTGAFYSPSTWDCNCVPDSLDSPIIVTGHTVTLNYNASVASIEIRGSFIVQNGVTLRVREDWLNTGAFTQNQSTISFVGTGDHTIAGSRSQTFYNLSIQNGCNLSNNAGLLNLEGIMTFNNGNFLTNDSLNLVSNQNGTGAIGSLTSGTLSGNVLSNRYIGAGATGWRFLTSCIQGATLADIDDDIITSGVPGSDYPNFSFVSIWDYDETVLGNKDLGYFIPSGMGASISPGKGYWVFAGDNLSGTAAFNIDFYGAINQGAINLPVSFTSTPDDGDGWNLVANPYPCAIDWDSPNWTKTAISDETHIYNPNSGTYAVYAGGIGANGGTGSIASNQAFWVKCVAPSTGLTVREDCKITTNSDPWKSSSSKDILRINCKKTAQSSYSDEIVLVHNEYESNKHSIASKFLSDNENVMNIMVNSDGIKSSIYGTISLIDTIPLRIEGNSQNIVLSFKDLGYLKNYWTVYLFDSSTDSLWRIENNMQISISKSISGSNDDLMLITVPAVNLNIQAPLCNKSDNGSISIHPEFQNNSLFLEFSPNDFFTQSIAGTWSQLNVSDYHLTIVHPIDNSLTFDTVISLIPEINGVITAEPIVLNNYNQLDEIFVEEDYQEYSWFINGSKIELNSNRLEKEIVLDHLRLNSENIIKFSSTNYVGCDKSYQWVIYLPQTDLIYPNPISTGQTLNLWTNEGLSVVSIYNLYGQLINRFTISSGSSNYSVINTENLATGVYHIEVVNDNIDNIYKLVVHE